MVFRYCLGMIMSVSTLIIFSGAATPSSTVNFSIFHLARRGRAGVRASTFPDHALNGASKAVGQPCAAGAAVLAGSFAAASALNFDSRSSVHTWTWYSV